MVVKSFGTSRWTDKNGNERSKFGPMYLHFEKNCLQNVDSENHYGPSQIFDYSRIAVDQKWKDQLSEAENRFLIGLGLNFQWRFQLFILIFQFLSIDLNIDFVFTRQFSFLVYVWYSISESYFYSISNKIWDWCNLYKNVFLQASFSPTFYSTQCIVTAQVVFNSFIGMLIKFTVYF